MDNSSQSNKNQEIWSKIENRILKNPKITLGIMIIGLLSFVFTICSFILAINTVDVDVQEILVGLAPFHINDKSNLEDRYLIKLKQSNTFLREQNSEYRLYPYVSYSGGYKGVLSDLKHNKIKIAFVSQCMYTMLSNNKICDFPWDSEKNRDLTNTFELLGYKKHNGNNTYSSGIIYNKQDSSYLRKFFIKFEKNIPDSLIKEFKDSISLILNTEEYSTSSHIVPEIFLLEKGVNFKNDISHLSFSRVEMKRKILENEENKKYIGFISNEDYLSLPPSDRENLGFWDMKNQIPYDAILVNTKWWKGVRSRKEDILRALNTNPLGFVEKDCNCADYKLFQDYLTSGIVYKIENDTLGFVQFPDKQFDIHGFNQVVLSRNVKLVKFRIGNKSSRIHFILDTIDLGEGKLSYCNGEYNIVSKNLLQGAHVLPKN